MSEHLDLPRAVTLGALVRHITESHRPTAVMREPTGGHPTDHLAVVPDRLVADAVRRLRAVAGIEGEQAESPLRRLLGRHLRGITADERLVEAHAPSHVRLVGAVDRPILRRPGTPTLVETQRVERTTTEEPHPVTLTGGRHHVEELA